MMSMSASQAKPSQAKPSQAKPSQAKPSQAKPRIIFRHPPRNIFRGISVSKIISFLVFTLFSNIYAKPITLVPEWMKNIRSVYPDEVYIAQRGEGKNPEIAKANALSILGQYIKTNVESNLSTNLKVIDGKSYSQIQEEVKVYSDVELLGVQYSEIYYEKKAKFYYCVAFLEREYAWKQYLPKIESEKSLFYDFFNEAKSQTEKEPLLASLYFVKAKKQGRKFITALTYGRILNEMHEKAYSADRETVASIDKFQADTILDATIFIDVRNDFEQIVSTKIKDDVRKSGFIIADAMEDARYVLIANVIPNFQTVDDGAGGNAYNSTPSLEISISGIQSKKAVFNYSLKSTKRLFAYSKEAAMKKSYSQLVFEMGRKLIDEFNAVTGIDIYL